MNILGISCFYHDAAAALVSGGRLVAAAQEERFTRRKHDPDFPLNAARYCLKAGGISPAQLDYAAFYDKPFVKFDRILQTAIATWPRSFTSFLAAMPPWLKEKLWIPQIVRKRLGYDGPVLFAEHHISHAASAFFASSFSEAAILTLDGVGEWDTTTWGAGSGNTIRLMKSVRFPHSLGLFYSAFTDYLGFRVNSAEYKVMGLAPYGTPLYAPLIRRRLIDVRDDGSFRLNMEFFEFDRALRMTGPAFAELFGRPKREPESGIDRFHMDIAASLQEVTNDVVVRLAQHARSETGLQNLCMAGGVALNCVANSRILGSVPFKNIFIQPAAGDAGGAVGAALYVHNAVLGNPREFVWSNAFLGPEYTDAEIEACLDEAGTKKRRLERGDLIGETARRIAEQQVVGWFQGRMEFGPRALGARSILADPRNAENWQRVNMKIKFRESFRPLAPAVLEERSSERFEFEGKSPYMLFVARVREGRRDVPAVTHVDGTARIQTVARDDHPLFYDLIAEFDRRTGCPMVVNTSFNVRGEPIVCSPQDALRCFMKTGMDALVIGPFIVERRDLPAAGPPET